MTETVYYDGVWQDREVRFDANLLHLALCKGEYVIDTINAVEDTKGNNGERGSLSITNLRIIWCCHSKPKVNLSIGLGTISGLSIQNANSRLRGMTQSLQILIKSGTTRYEFIFTSLVNNSPRLFSSVQTVIRAYETTRLYRDLKLRCAIVKDGQLLLLPDEQIFTQISNVTNLAGEQRNLGMFFITNIRVVWYAALAEQFNVSIPYIQIANVRLRESKAQQVMVIETTRHSGSFVLGFSVDSPKQLQQIFKEVSTLLGVFHDKPNFGIKCVLDDDEQIVKSSNAVVNPILTHMASHFKDPVPGLEEGRLPNVAKQQSVIRAEEDAKIVETTDNQHFNTLASYYVDAFADPTTTSTAATAKGEVVSAGAGPAVYSDTLGLAIEELRPGVKLSDLWEILAPE